MSDLTHLDGQGRAHMVDVSAKPPLKRTAIAQGRIALAPATVALLRGGGVPKGDAIATARIAGIMAAKRTPDFIPLCHPILLSHISVAVEVEDAGAVVTATVACTGPTGVEMEALTAVSAALLSLYDMCKAVDKAMVITGITLIEKRKETSVP